MTRTEKLGLCTWLPEDPVSLSEMNDNFTRLDASGGQALRLSQNGLITLGGLLAAQAHFGAHGAYAEGIAASAFQDTAQMDGFAGGLLWRNKKLEVVTAALAAGSVSGGTSTSQGSGDYHAENIIFTVSERQQWVQLFTFQPDAYGTITSLTLQTASTASLSTAAHVKLSIWAGETKLCETSMGTITRPSGADTPVSFSLSQAVNPNIRYSMRIWIEDMPTPSAGFETMTFAVTPNTYASASFTAKAMTLPAGTQHIAVLVHASGIAPQAALRFGTGSYTTMSAQSTRDDLLSNGTACKVYQYLMTVPDGAAKAQLRLTLPGAACQIHDFAMILL